MARARHDITPKDNTYRRIELITGSERRRRWSVDEKLMILSESYATSAPISDVARRHGLSRTQLYHWRRQFRNGQFTGGVLQEGFVPVVSGSLAASEENSDITRTATYVSAALREARFCDVIEVIVGVITVRVPTVADEVTLRRVLDAVRSLT